MGEGDLGKQARELINGDNAQLIFSQGRVDQNE